MAGTNTSGVGEDDKLRTGPSTSLAQTSQAVTPAAKPAVQKPVLPSNSGGNPATRSLRFNTSRAPGFYGDRNVTPDPSTTAQQTGPTSALADVVAEPVAKEPYRGDALNLGINPADPAGILPEKMGRQIDRTASNVIDPGGLANRARGGKSNDYKTTVSNSLDPAGILSPGGRVICTELHRKKEIDHDLYMADVQFTASLSPITVRGYHWWAVPCVRLMRRHPMIRGVMKWIAIVRAEEIGYQVGVRNAPNYAGKAVRLVGESLCFAIGLFVGTTNWSALYQEKPNV